jgi:hypothetical protein
MFITHVYHLELWYVTLSPFTFPLYKMNILFYHDGLPSYGNGDNCL